MNMEGENTYDWNSFIDEVDCIEERRQLRYGEDDPSYYPVLELLSQRWTVKILRRIREKPARFCQLTRDMRMNPNTLKARILELEASEIIERICDPKLTTIVTYSLTKRGVELVQAFESLHQFMVRQESCETLSEASMPTTPTVL